MTHDTPTDSAREELEEIREELGEEAFWALHGTAAREMGLRPDGEDVEKDLPY